MAASALHRAAGLVALLCAACAPAAATDFNIVSLPLGGGLSLSGTFSTDGTIGVLQPANFTAWHVVIRSSTTLAYTPLNAAPIQISQVTVTPDGRRLRIASSPDGVNDGGILAFGSFGIGPEFGVWIANFSGYYAPEGDAFYLSGSNFEWQPLGVPYHAQYVAGKAPAGSLVFTLTPVTFLSGAVMSGTVTTDGQVGTLGPQNLRDWHVQVRQVTETVFYSDATGANSRVLPPTIGVSTDGANVYVARPGGYLGFGVAPPPPYPGSGGVLADFGTGAPKRGQAGFYDAVTYQFKPLNFGGSARVVATVVP